MHCDVSKDSLPKRLRSTVIDLLEEETILSSSAEVAGIRECQKPKGEKAHDQCPTHLAISHTCTRVGFNVDDLLQIIHLYAVRNELLHANFIPLIKNGLFHDLKKQLYNDFCDIPLIIPDVEKTIDVDDETPRNNHRSLV